MVLTGVHNTKKSVYKSVHLQKTIVCTVDDI